MHPSHGWYTEERHVTQIRAKNIFKNTYRHIEYSQTTKGDTRETKKGESCQTTKGDIRQPKKEEVIKPRRGTLWEPLGSNVDACICLCWVVTSWHHWKLEWTRPSLFAVLDTEEALSYLTCPKTTWTHTGLEPHGPKTISIHLVLALCDLEIFWCEGLV